MHVHMLRMSLSPYTLGKYVSPYMLGMSVSPHTLGMYLSPHTLDMYLHVSPYIYTRLRFCSCWCVYISHNRSIPLCTTLMCLGQYSVCMPLTTNNCFDFNVDISSDYSLILGVYEPPIQCPGNYYTSLHNP